MVINKFVVLFLLVFPAMAMACPEAGWEKISKRLLYEQKDIRRGEVEGIKVGWTKDQLSQYLGEQQVGKVELVPVRDFYATAKCIDELDKIADINAIWVMGANMRKIAYIAMEGGAVAEVDLAHGSELSIKHGDSLRIVILRLKELLQAGGIQGVIPGLSCRSQCFFKFEELLLSSESLAFRFISKDRRGRITVYFSAGRVVRATYLRQRFQGDGVL